VARQWSEELFRVFREAKVKSVSLVKLGLAALGKEEVKQA